MNTFTVRMTGLLAFIMLPVVDGMSQEQSTADVLKRIDPAAHVLRGQWSVDEEGVTGTSDTGAMCVVPYEISGAYTLTFEFTRSKGKDVVGVVLPLRTNQVFFELSGWEGLAHGLSRVNQAGTRSDENPTSHRPGTIENGRRYRAEVKVTPDADSVSIQAKLNDDVIIDWTGTLTAIEPNFVYNIRSNTRPALATSKSTTTFHSLRISHELGAGKPIDLDLRNTRSPAAASMPQGSANPNATITKVPASGGEIDLKDIVWSDAVGKIDLTSFQGEQVVRIRGQDDSIALLPGSMMANGEIEVDIASDIFSGIAFRVADLKNYDLVYFRPQNSGTAKHQNTVQYACVGKEGADWSSLRKKFPGKYESGADIKPNEWFHLKLVLSGGQVSAYVNDRPMPVLVIDPLLGERDRGGIGIWGWNTRFRNFSFKPR